MKESLGTSILNCLLSIWAGFLLTVSVGTRGLLLLLTGVAGFKVSSFSIGVGLFPVYFIWDL